MKKFAVVLCAYDDDPKIQFIDAEDWREVALAAAKEQSADYPLWSCLDVPDEAMAEESAEEEGEETGDPIMVPLSLKEAQQDAANGDCFFAIAEVPTV